MRRNWLFARLSLLKAILIGALYNRSNLDTNIPLLAKVVRPNKGVLGLDTGLKRYLPDAEGLGQSHTYRDGTADSGRASKMRKFCIAIG
jgi:hypothetical protein